MIDVPVMSAHEATQVRALGARPGDLVKFPITGDVKRVPAHAACDDADQSAEGAFAEPLATFAARPHLVPDHLIARLIPGQGISLLHGQPRALKSWTALEIATAAALGVPPFDIAGFAPARPVRTWYVTEEDPAPEVRARLRCILAGRNITGREHPLFVSAQGGITLDDPEWQERLVQFAADERIELTVLDPLRAVTSSVDQGPREIQPLARYLRRFMRTTGSVLLLVHHDVKPPAGKPDDRAKPQRASGGGIFSIADAPIHAELIGPGSRAILTPSHYKFSVAPEPFIVRLDTDDPHRPTSARLVGENTSAKGATDLDVHQKVLGYLTGHPDTSGSALAKALHLNKAVVLAALDAMHAKDVLTFAQRGQARLWTVKPTGGTP
jgi:hypothetical protein